MRVTGGSCCGQLGNWRHDHTLSPKNGDKDGAPKRSSKKDDGKGWASRRLWLQTQVSEARPGAPAFVVRIRSGAPRHQVSKFAQTRQVRICHVFRSRPTEDASYAEYKNPSSGR